MQSGLQYRHLQREIQDDIQRSLQSSRSAGSFTHASIFRLKTAQGSLNEERPDLNQVAKKSTPSLHTSLLRGVKELRPGESQDEVVSIVNWSEDDRSNLQHWPLARKWMATVICCVISTAMTLPTSVEDWAKSSFDATHGVGPLAGSMTIGIFLNDIGVSSLFTGPLSETFGPNVVYVSALFLAMLFVMTKALAPNYGAATTFRFLCALFVAAPMRSAGGTIGDIWQPHSNPVRPAVCYILRMFWAHEQEHAE
ncbi:MAG: hypothetical protein M1828_001363 [Chrysothrix sp. TS-e1954]|nr:MAG: hypothetical protein M1828_001363 [Chrysothrix sp. TS-e1954]